MTWKVLKQYDGDDGQEVWVNVGNHETDTDFYIDADAPTQIGKRFGPGAYLLLNDQRYYARLDIGSRQQFFEIKDETPALVEA